MSECLTHSIKIFPQTPFVLSTIRGGYQSDMPLPTSIAAVILTATLAQVTRALPISQNHRFAVYTPYWHQGPRHYVPPDFYSSHKRLGCGTEPCDERLNQLLSLPDESTSTNNIPLTKRTKNSYRTGKLV